MGERAARLPLRGGHVVGRRAADAEDFKLEAALSDAADEMAASEKQAAP